MNAGPPRTPRDTIQYKCHNCSCGTKAVENLRRYRKRIDIYQPDGPRKYFVEMKRIYDTALGTLVSLQGISFYTYLTCN